MKPKFIRSTSRALREQRIRDINATPLDKLSEDELLVLAVGALDNVSRLKGDSLRKLISVEDAEAIEAEFEEKPRWWRDGAMRWVCRGLEVRRAIRKVKADMEYNNDNEPVWDMSDI